MLLYVVQREEGGIPDDPIIYRKESDALAKYLLIAGLICRRRFKTEEAASDALRNCNGDPYVRLWEIKVR